MNDRSGLVTLAIYTTAAMLIVLVALLGIFRYGAMARVASFETAPAEPPPELGVTQPQRLPGTTTLTAWVWVTVGLSVTVGVGVSVDVGVWVSVAVGSGVSLGKASIVWATEVFTIWATVVARASADPPHPLITIPITPMIKVKRNHFIFIYLSTKTTAKP